MSKKHLHLFQGYGIELEYMIVDKDTLQVLPIADHILQDGQGNYSSDLEFDKTAWSNELVLHVIELKTNGPCAELANQPGFFQQDIIRINQQLAKFNAKLMPTGAHPFMDPYTESKLWPHDDNIIYDTYNKIFNCRGHGWSNLQSTHLNLPFADDAEFSKLHTAIRLILPIIPALSASTPILDGKNTHILDTRLEYYHTNQQKIPSITGHVIPESVISQSEYQEKILEKMYADIALYDTEATLQYEWLNSRGAIARFDRNTIEIRIIDIQECPLADIAILAAVTAVLKALVAEKWTNFNQQLAWSEINLSHIFKDCIKTGMQTLITDSDYLANFDYTTKSTCTAQELWSHILQQVFFNDSNNQTFFAPLQLILTKGNLSERILSTLPNSFKQEDICQIYDKLAACLAEGHLFNA